ncbi:MAG: nucleotidyltransferase domain-containing protein [Deltaproteobacteria bacterium]|jgi:predicted nucleotidyltransferase|nr:nucleotidyltransferase domain-containing protein [Deltaproteobacteria bacterium]
MKEKVYILTPVEKQRLSGRLAVLLGACPEVIFAYVYGSFLEDIPCHDIDLGVYVTGVKRAKTILHGVDLAGSFSRELGIPVDVRILNYAPNSFVYRVIRGKLILDNNPEVRSRVVEETIKHYLDLKPLRFRAIREAFAA